MRRQRSLLVLLLLMVVSAVGAPGAGAQMKSGDVDIFMGLDLHYRDIWFNNRPFDFLLQLTPGVKWNFGNHWQIEAGALIPIVNQYGENEKYVRINVAALSKEFAIGRRWRSKVSGGIFTDERYGIDFKTQYQFNSWLAANAELGLTGRLAMNKTWAASPMSRFTFTVGPEFWLEKWQTTIKAQGGRYVYGDFGAVAEVFRHFKHVSVGVFGQYSQMTDLSAGFKVVIMIPPYKRSCRRVHFRPASNFRLSFNTQADNRGNTYYRTDQEQNDRQGWFSRDLLPWGNQTLAPDFRPCDKDVSLHNADTDDVSTSADTEPEEKGDAI